MSTWRLKFAPKAVKQLAKLNKPTTALILAWLEKNIDGCTNPRQQGKALVGNLAGSWRYRIGDYRVLSELHDTELVILAVEIAHRREAYKKK